MIPYCADNAYDLVLSIAGQAVPGCTPETVLVANRFSSRLRGLLGNQAQACWLPGCRWVHSLGMGQPLLLMSPVRAALGSRQEPVANSQSGKIVCQWLRPWRVGVPVQSAVGTLEIRCDPVADQKGIIFALLKQLSCTSGWEIEIL